MMLEPEELQNREARLARRRERYRAQRRQESQHTHTRSTNVSCSLLRLAPQCPHSLVYCIAVNFRGSIGSENFTEKTFTDKIFTDCLKPIIGGCSTPPNFAEKTFADGSQTSKSTKAFSLESFLLYGIPLY